MASLTASFTVEYATEHQCSVPIPGVFRDVLDNGSLCVRILLHGSVKEWKVTMVHEEDDEDVNNGWKTILEAGWPEFVKDNCLNYRDSLYFTYSGHNAFVVQISRGSISKGKGKGKDVGSSSKRRIGRIPAYLRSSPEMIETNEWIDDLVQGCPSPNFRFIFTAAYLRKAAINIPINFARHWLVHYPETTYHAVLQNFDTQFDVELYIEKKNGVITECLIRKLRDFLDCYNVQENKGAFITLSRTANHLIFDVDLVLV
ncbi:uncharacterized protein LOC110696965 [Chenopodium quinoa]|uniref:uncharacterized protein LOC110696965 n=1 Tax=Chenopodium quinoa TaxID=63459 RepID=UPI000B78F440|nr:uncharacterized protein LOC110696965 [Chenopodium quinoa]